MEDPSLTPQEIVQKLYTLAGDQYFNRSNPALEAKLRNEIASHGGLAALDTWMNEHDPNHSKPSEMALDWSWFTASDS